MSNPNIINLITSEEQSRILGEKSSLKGKDYENIASFHILKDFHKITRLKIKIRLIYFNTIEDLDIVDEKNRLITFQIKQRDSIFRKSDPEIIKFFIRCVNRYQITKENNLQPIRSFFFTDTTGDFLENFKKKEGKSLRKELPKQVKDKLKEKKLNEREVDEILSDIELITKQGKNLLEKHLNKELYQKFLQLKNEFKPGNPLSYNQFTDSIFSELRRQNARVFEPAQERDEIICNALEVIKLPKVVWSGKLIEDMGQSDLYKYLSTRPKWISCLIKYGKIYTFLKFNNQNPLVHFVDSSKEIKKEKFDNLEDNDAIALLNKWLRGYLIDMGLKYYPQDNKIYYYLISENEERTLNWEDFYSDPPKYKSFKVVGAHGDDYYNQAARIYFRKYGGKFIVFICPRLLFTDDGKTVVPTHKIKRYERKYRQIFMKNDYLRRRFLLWVSILKKKIKEEPKKRELEEFNNSKPRPKRKKYVKTKSLEGAFIEFGTPIKLIANFKPNIEAKSEERTEGYGLEPFFE